MFSSFSCKSLCIVLLFWLGSLYAFAPLKTTTTRLASSTTRHAPVRHARFASALYYRKNATDVPPIKRFEKTAAMNIAVDEPCILTIDGIRYNITAWANAHPGGVKVLQKFHDKDASKAFHAASHSAAAYDMLKDFAIEEDLIKMNTTLEDAIITKCPVKKVPRWRAKLFTKEDPIGVHKYLGVFCLLHFIFRFAQMLLGDPSCGLGTRLGKGPSWIAKACLVPHGLLSASSLIFHTVPKERVVGLPMIWQEFRAHNIGFGIRSVVAAAACSIAIHFGNTPAWRQFALWTSSLACIGAMVAADLSTKYLRVNNEESTTATMPYWDGCSVKTQKRFKAFYAYSQFMATIACFATTNPAYPLSVLLAIQMASLLMTLVRKGLLSARGYHYGYTATLVLPYVVGLRCTMLQKSLELPFLFIAGSLMFMLRRQGVGKYALWLPAIAARVAFGDAFMNYGMW